MLTLALCLSAYLLDVLPAQAPTPFQKITPVIILSGNDSKQTRKSYWRCDAQYEWQAAWQKHNGHEALLPTNDFENYMVVVIFLNKGESDVGIVIHAVEESKDIVRLRYKPFTYQIASANFAPNGFVNTSNTENTAKKKDNQCFAFVILHKTSKPIVIEEDVQSLLTSPPSYKERVRLPKMK